MGCNFYTLDNKHIGKRSAAGFYCWDCGISLCKEGDQMVHSGVGFYNSCPMCGRPREMEKIENSAAGRELGFNKNPFKKKDGVKSCSSFNWAIYPVLIRRRRKIKDEYGRVYSRAEFNAMLTECPIQFFDSIGKEFS